MLLKIKKYLKKCQEKYLKRVLKKDLKKDLKKEIKKCKEEIKLVPQPAFIEAALLIQKDVKMTRNKDRSNVFIFGGNIHVVCDEYKGEDYYLLIKDEIFERFVIKEKKERTFIGNRNYLCIGDFSMNIVPIECSKKRVVPSKNIKIITEEYIHIKYKDGTDEYYLGKNYRVVEM
jgi:hypothetical protein